MLHPSIAPFFLPMHTNAYAHLLNLPGSSASSRARLCLSSSRDKDYSRSPHPPPPRGVNNVKRRNVGSGEEETGLESGISRARCFPRRKKRRILLRPVNGSDVPLAHKWRGIGNGIVAGGLEVSTTEGSEAPCTSTDAFLHVWEECGISRME